MLHRWSLFQNNRMIKKNRNTPATHAGARDRHRPTFLPHRITGSLVHERSNPFLFMPLISAVVTFRSIVVVPGHEFAVKSSSAAGISFQFSIQRLVLTTWHLRSCFGNTESRIYFSNQFIFLFYNWPIDIALVSLSQSNSYRYSTNMSRKFAIQKWLSRRNRTE